MITQEQEPIAPLIDVFAVEEASWQAALTEVRAGSAKAVLALLTAKGVNAKERSQKAAGALHAAAASGQNGAIADLVASLQVPIDAPDGNGVTALRHAALMNRLDTARHLVSDLGAAHGATDSSGNTPLHLASREGHAGMARFLTANERVCTSCSLANSLSSFSSKKGVRCRVNRCC